MGIQGLHSAVLSKVGEARHISVFRGKKVAVDAMTWLHRGCHGCATELALNLKTDAYVKFCLGCVEVRRGCWCCSPDPACSAPRRQTR